MNKFLPVVKKVILFFLLWFLFFVFFLVIENEICGENGSLFYYLCVIVAPPLIAYFFVNISKLKEKLDSLRSNSGDDSCTSERIKQIKIEEEYREHRLKLQEYSKKLVERKDEFNRQLDKRSAELDQRESEIDKKEQKMVEDATKKAKEKLSKLANESCHLDKEIEEKENRIKGLYNTEYALFGRIKAIDNREKETIYEIQSDLEKFEKFKDIANGYDFEEYTANLLLKNGYESIQVTKKSNDFGADVTASKDGVNYVFQCKYYSSAVGIEAIQQIYASKAHYNSHVAIVVTNSIFTKAAKILASELNVILWDGETIARMEEKETGDENAKEKNG